MEREAEYIGQWLCEMATADSQAAFKRLYLFYFPKLMRFVLRYVPNGEEAEELVSDTLLAIWSNRQSLPAIANFKAYIYAIARHKIVSYWRVRPQSSVRLDELNTDLFFQTEVTPEAELISREEVMRLNAAVDALPAKCKLAFKLVREERLKYKEVAEILGISIKTLESHLATAVRKLREALREGGREAER